MKSKFIKPYQINIFAGSIPISVGKIYVFLVRQQFFWQLTSSDAGLGDLYRIEGWIEFLGATKIGNQQRSVVL